MDDTEARQLIVSWAKNYYSDNEDHVTPDVEILEIAYDEKEEEWEATLFVSTSADNPTITFFLYDKPGYNRLQIVTVEY